MSTSKQGVPKVPRAPAAAKVSVAQAIRDVFITSINRGQFPFAVFGAVVLLMIAKVPTDEMVPLIKWIVSSLSGLSLIGYLLFVIVVFAWYFHVQRIRRELTTEIETLRLGLKNQRRAK